MFREYGEFVKIMDFAALNKFVEITKDQTDKLLSIIQDRQVILDNSETILVELEEEYNIDKQEMLSKCVDRTFRERLMRRYKEIYMENMMDLGRDVANIDNTNDDDLVEGVLCQKYMQLFDKKIRLNLFLNDKQRDELES